MIFEGVNDIGSAPTTPEAQEQIYQGLTQAYEQMVTLIHAHGIPVFGATITPFSAPANFTQQPYSDPEREKTRQRVNTFIRTSGVLMPSWTLISSWPIPQYRVNSTRCMILVIIFILILPDTSTLRINSLFRFLVCGRMVRMSSVGVCNTAEKAILQ